MPDRVGVLRFPMTSRLFPLLFFKPYLRLSNKVLKCFGNCGRTFTNGFRVFLMFITISLRKQCSTHMWTWAAVYDAQCQPIGRGRWGEGHGATAETRSADFYLQDRTTKLIVCIICDYKTISASEDYTFVTNVRKCYLTNS